MRHFKNLWIILIGVGEIDGKKIVIIG